MDFNVKELIKHPLLPALAIFIILAGYFIFIRMPKLATEELQKKEAVLEAEKAKSVVGKNVSTITLLSPNGGESFKSGDLHSIRWESNGVGVLTNIKITYVSEVAGIHKGGIPVATTKNAGSITVATPAYVRSVDIPLPYPQCEQGKDAAVKYWIKISVLDAGGKEQFSDLSDGSLILTGPCKLSSP